MTRQLIGICVLDAAEGELTREEWKANPSAPIDCFYVDPNGRALGYRPQVLQPSQ